MVSSSETEEIWSDYDPVVFSDDPAKPARKRYCKKVYRTKDNLHHGPPPLSQQQSQEDDMDEEEEEEEREERDEDNQCVTDPSTDSHSYQDESDYHAEEEEDEEDKEKNHYVDSSESYQDQSANSDNNQQEEEEDKEENKYADGQASGNSYYPEEEKQTDEEVTILSPSSLCRKDPFGKREQDNYDADTEIDDESQEQSTFLGPSTDKLRSYLHLLLTKTDRNAARTRCLTQQCERQFGCSLSDRKSLIQTIMNAFYCHQKPNSTSDETNMPKVDRSQSSVESNLIELVEIVDKRMVKYLIDNFDSLAVNYSDESDDNGIYTSKENQRRLLKKYYHALDSEDKVRTTYFQKDGRGRYYASASTSLQSMKKVFRHTLARNQYYDLDMANAQPTLLLAYCKTVREWATPCLDYFIHNREACYTELMSTMKISRDQAKDMYLAVINGAKRKSTCHFFNKFAAEMNSIQQEIFNNEMECREHAKQVVEENKKKGKYKNLYGSSISYLLSGLENLVLMEMKGYLEDHNIEVGVLVFDGLMIRKGDYNLDQLLKGLTNLVSDMLQIEMKIVNKPMDQALHISEEELTKIDATQDKRSRKNQSHRDAQVILTDEDQEKLKTYTDEDIKYCQKHIGRGDDGYAHIYARKRKNIVYIVDKKTVYMWDYNELLFLKVVPQRIWNDITAELEFVVQMFYQDQDQDQGKEKKKILKYIRSTSGGSAIYTKLLDLLQAPKDFIKQLDKSPLIPCANGMAINPRTGDFKKRTYQDHFSVCMPHEYLGQGLEKTPRAYRLALEFCNVELNEDKTGPKNPNDARLPLVPYLQKILGCFLTIDNLDKLAFVFHGPSGDNGKTTLLGKILKKVMGPFYLTAPKALLHYVASSGKSSATPELMILEGPARLACLTETGSKPIILNSELIKALVGDDAIKGRQLHDPTGYRDIYTNAHLALCTNPLPRFDCDPTMRSKVKLFPCEAKFERNRNNTYLKDLQATGLSDLFTFMVNGAILYYQEGLNEPDLVTTYNTSKIAELNPVFQFLSYFDKDERTDKNKPIDNKLFSSQVRQYYHQKPLGLTTDEVYKYYALYVRLRGLTNWWSTLSRDKFIFEARKHDMIGQKECRRSKGPVYFKILPKYIVKAVDSDEYIPEFPPQPDTNATIDPDDDDEQ